MSSSPSSYSRDFFFDGATLSPGRYGGGKAATVASFPCDRFDLTEMKASKLTTILVGNAASVRVHGKFFFP